MYKKININKVLYKTLITTSFNFISIKFIFKSVNNKKERLSESHVASQIDRLGGLNQYGQVDSIG